MKTPKGEINDQIFELVKDEALMEKMKAAKSPEECYELVKDKITIGFEDFQSSMTIANEYLSEKESGTLTEEDLEQIAGGKGLQQTIDNELSAIGVIAGVIGAAAGAAAA